MSKWRLSAWQAQVLTDLDAIAEAFPGEVELLGGHRLGHDGWLRFGLRVRTGHIPCFEGGLRLREYEDFLVSVGRSDLAPPRVEVDHLRFLNHAHVLQGTRLCLYLDPSREWDPANGFGGLVDRLVGWLNDAAAARFDAQTALYHAVGGVLHTTDGAPSVVLRESLRPGVRCQPAWLVPRTAHRYDLVLRHPRDSPDAQHLPVLTLDAALPLGAGSSLLSVLSMADNPYNRYPAPGDVFRKNPINTGLSGTLLTALGASAIRKPGGTPQGIVIAVPHPTGGAPHLLVAHIPTAGADRIRALVRDSRKRSSMIDINFAQVGTDVPLEWWPVSDERAEVTTRRDSARPVAAFSDMTVHIWGCGGLGSWVAELVVRAGAAKVALCDPGGVTGGLLVRQNYVEADVGNCKVDGLAKRLRAISDNVDVTVCDSMTPALPNLTDVDVIIDATVSVAISRVLDQISAMPGRPVLAQMATDARTGTLGVLTVSMPPETAGPLTIDRYAGQVVATDGTLEAFQTLWKSAPDNDEIIPTRGCSTPTFHGSAADLAGVAASLTSILGSHLGAHTTVSGTHLISLPHGEAGPLRRFVPKSGAEPEAHEIEEPAGAS